MRILIVEDEKIERETLVHILEKSSFFEEVLSARNGKSALEIYKEKHPEIVCADINMPGINGLDMVRKMKEEQVNSEFIILSSYNYFTYAQEAIRLGVMDYILKPYNIPQFLSSLEKVVNKVRGQLSVEVSELSTKIKEGTPAIVHDVLYAILSDEVDIDLHRKIHLINRDIKSGFCLLLHGVREISESLQVLFQRLEAVDYLCIYEIIHGSTVCMIMRKSTFTKEHMDEILPFLKELPYTKELGIGPVVNTITKFHTSFLEAQNHIGKTISIHDQLFGILKADESHHYPVSTTVKQLLLCFDKLEEDCLKRQICQLCDYLLLQKQEDIFAFVDQLYEEIIEGVKQKYPDIDFHDYQLLSLHASHNVYQELLLNLNLNLKKLYHKVSEIRFQNTNHLVKEAILFIEENYYKQITLPDLASHLKVSPFYISKLLSNSLHKTFTELLSVKRIEISKELLRKDERIKEIAGKVGFQGQSYYNKIFKKYTGMTPKVYRNKMKV